MSTSLSLAVSIPSFVRCCRSLTSFSLCSKASRICHGFCFEGKFYWTQTHLTWLETLVFENALYQETLQEYLILYYTLAEKVDSTMPGSKNCPILNGMKKRSRSSAVLRPLPRIQHVLFWWRSATIIVFGPPNTLPLIWGLFLGSRPAVRNKCEQELRKLAIPI